MKRLTFSTWLRRQRNHPERGCWFHLDERRNWNLAGFVRRAHQLDCGQAFRAKLGRFIYAYALAVMRAEDRRKRKAEHEARAKQQRRKRLRPRIVRGVSTRDAMPKELCMID